MYRYEFFEPQALGSKRRGAPPRRHAAALNSSLLFSSVSGRMSGRRPSGTSRPRSWPCSCRFAVLDGKYVFSVFPPDTKYTVYLVYLEEGGENTPPWCICVFVSRSNTLCILCILRGVCVYFPSRLSSRHHRLKTFAKRAFHRWRALPLGRDLSRVRHDAMGFARSRAGSSLPLRYH